jgi:hypothetical protein
LPINRSLIKPGSEGMLLQRKVSGRKLGLPLQQLEGEQSI